MENAEDTWHPLSNIALALPPLEEQIAIAAFLDRETGKIDALVEEQRRLIALLKEKRQAVISHAVTKGLDPHAPMKRQRRRMAGRSARALGGEANQARDCVLRTRLEPPVRQQTRGRL